MAGGHSPIAFAASTIAPVRMFRAVEALPSRDGGNSTGPTVRLTTTTPTTSIASRNSSVTVSQTGSAQAATPPQVRIT
jgi:hypothetical protein